jgi:hypothetical protein
LNDRTRVVEIPDIVRLGLEGGRAAESSETAGKGKQRIEDGFFYDGLCVFFNPSARTTWRRRGWAERFWSFRGPNSPNQLKHSAANLQVTFV